MRVIYLLIIFILNIGFTFSQSNSNFQTIRSKGVKVTFVEVSENDEDRYLSIKIKNLRLKPIYFDTTYFYFSIRKDSVGAIGEQLHGRTYHGTIPINNIHKLNLFSSYSFIIPLPRKTEAYEITGMINFIIHSDYKNYLRFRKDLGEESLYTDLIDIYSKRVPYSNK